MHTIEHLFATFARNSAVGQEILYVGPMGCRTGFYLLVRDKVSHSQAIDLVYQAMEFVATYEGEIPGTTSIECGNYLEHDLIGAKKEASAMAAVLKECDETKIYYKS